MNDITYSESLEIPDRIYIDVRAPIEFAEDHVEGAVNIPLFDDSERREVGTMYRAMGRDSAITRGTAIVGGKLPELVGSFMQYRDRNIVIMCARGGMRSGSLAALLDSLGMPVFRLRDGYKGYRRHVAGQLASILLPAPLFVLQGLTGTGKTEIIRKLPYAIDLEGMAGHRSSVFGGIGIAQKSQKRFESLLCDRIRGLAGAPGIVIEGESRKIGNLHLPPSLYELMRCSPSIPDRHAVRAPRRDNIQRVPRALHRRQHSRHRDRPYAEAGQKKCRSAYRALPRGKHTGIHSHHAGNLL